MIIVWVGRQLGYNSTWIQFVKNYNFFVDRRRNTLLTLVSSSSSPQYIKSLQKGYVLQSCKVEFKATFNQISKNNYRVNEESSTAKNFKILENCYNKYYHKISYNYLTKNKYNFLSLWWSSSYVLSTLPLFRLPLKIVSSGNFSSSSFAKNFLKHKNSFSIENTFNRYVHGTNFPGKMVWVSIYDEPEKNQVY